MSKKKESPQLDGVSSEDTKRYVREFVAAIDAIDSEIETLKEDRKDTIEDYKEKLDMKTLKAVLSVMKIMKRVDNKGTFDEYKEAISTDV
jgi:uncharacterized protein (UPF0335 family)